MTKTIHKIFYKTEGNIIYPDKTMLTWGPFYYLSREKAKERIETVLKDIVGWCNEKDPTMNIQPQNLIVTEDKAQIVFDIKAWKDEETIQDCEAIITVEMESFEDC